LRQRRLASQPTREALDTSAPARAAAVCCVWVLNSSATPPRMALFIMRAMARAASLEEIWVMALTPVWVSRLITGVLVTWCYSYIQHCYMQAPDKNIFDRP